ncbi:MULTISPECIES: DUF3263 domain-containing protein [Frigoribacterium]|uniref:DUF3263 domain-containing protein n=1 Tax=Frigoribacterium TaxID=96492 RepID=UPI0017837388|nr:MULTISPECIES: DUF3263 domain-containing protein [Frigoribacterium]MBD8704517.1 DUF3263 domain-containing protein [Frigoribacterium sp. CFBP 13712]MCJ0701853.1 DUF3263 domain-containing protein [Frigoribacterium faeni]MDY0891960.1 DUF3263 domain-containing protein [Frigoribacterium sp. CFBP9030]
MGDSGATGDDGTVIGLSERDRAILDLEQSTTGSARQKEAVIRRDLGLSTARYQQLLNSLIDRPAALAYAPMLVGRLLRLRDARSLARTTRSFGPPTR